jgi:hypothetical protein
LSEVEVMILIGGLFYHTQRQCFSTIYSVNPGCKQNF